MVEMIKIEMETGPRRRLFNQIMSACEKRGLTSDYRSLFPGADLAMDWPAGDEKPTLAELVVVAQRLGMDIEITDLDLVERKGL